MWDQSKGKEAATMMLVYAGTHRRIRGWLCSTDGVFLERPQWWEDAASQTLEEFRWLANLK